MKKFNHTFLLFTVIVLEGYAVLATELLAIRQTVPFIGSGTDTVSIIIAAVLMPLAFGYYAGGKFKPGKTRWKRRVSARDKMVFNIVVAMTFLVAGLSFPCLKIFFSFFIKNLEVTHRHILATVYSMVFLVVPVYLLGQTIPLASNYFSHEKLSRITGRMLFFSTIGSFLGSVFSTLVLMSTIGVNYTAVVVFTMLALLVVLLSKHKLSGLTGYALILLIFSIFLNADATMRDMNIIRSNVYNTIAVFDRAGTRHLFLNGDPSSKYSDTGEKYAYVEFAEELTVDKALPPDPPKDFLVIGAGGFTFGFEDTHNNYDFVDIDKELQTISERYILQKPLPANKKFHPMEARAYLMGTQKKYDVILLDVYLGKLTIPEHLLTREFFQQVKDHLKENGVVITNFVASPNFASKFSRNLDNTVHSVFPHVSRHVIHDYYEVWNDDPEEIANIMYVYRYWPDAETDHIYTDNKNSSFRDRP
jgi:spermidine synthase